MVLFWVSYKVGERVKSPTGDFPAKRQVKRADPFLVRRGRVVFLTRQVENGSRAKAVAGRETVEQASRDDKKLRVVGGKDDGLAFCPVMDANLCRARHAIPPIPLASVPVPGFDYASRGRGDVSLAKPVRVIGCAVDLGELAALIEVRGQWAQLG